MDGASIPTASSKPRSPRTKRIFLRNPNGTLLFRQIARKFDAAGISSTVSRLRIATNAPPSPLAESDSNHPEHAADKSEVQRITFKLGKIPYEALEGLCLDVVTELECRQGSCRYKYKNPPSSPGGRSCGHPQRNAAQHKLIGLSDEDLGYLARELLYEVGRRHPDWETFKTLAKLRDITNENLEGLCRDVVSELVYRQKISNTHSNRGMEEFSTYDLSRNEAQQKLSSLSDEDIGNLAHSLLFEVGKRHPDWDIFTFPTISSLPSPPLTGNSLAGGVSPIEDETETLIGTPTTALPGHFAIFHNPGPLTLEGCQGSESNEMPEAALEGATLVPPSESQVMDKSLQEHDATNTIVLDPTTHKQGDICSVSSSSSDSLDNGEEDSQTEQENSDYKSLEALTPIPMPHFTDFSLSLFAEVQGTTPLGVPNEVSPSTGRRIPSAERPSTKLVLPVHIQRLSQSSPKPETRLPPSPDIELSSPLEASSMDNVHNTGPSGNPGHTRKKPFDRNSRLCLDGLVNDKSRFVVACGGFSDVWKGKLGERPVAIKVLRGFNGIGDPFAPAKMAKRLWREYLTWSSLSHPNVIECLGFTYDFVHESQYSVPALISPWMSQGTVLSYIQKNPKEDRMKLIVGITQGLCYLHKRPSPIIHGDIRAGNILVSDNGVACFTDFGLSRILQDEFGLTTSTDAAGSLRWMAPELFNNTKVSVASDVWAYGMTVLEILTEKRPYADISLEPAVLLQVIKGNIPSKPSPSGAPSITEELWNVCERCWAFKPDDRPPISQIAFDLVTEEKYREWQRSSHQSS